MRNEQKTDPHTSGETFMTGTGQIFCGAKLTCPHEITLTYLLTYLPTP